MPRFLALAELGILRHVAYAYGILLRTCSLCEGRSGNILRSSLHLLNTSNIMPYAFVNLLCGSWRFASYLLTLQGWDAMSLCLWHFGWLYFFIVSTSMEGLYMIQ